MNGNLANNYHENLNERKPTEKQNCRGKHTEIALELHMKETDGVKSVQSALSDLLTTSATHGTFSRPSTKRGLILIGLELNTNARESFEHC